MTKKREREAPVVAICYDFDKTLSPRDMQNFALIPKLHCSIEEFWAESNEVAKQNGMDKILAYMWLITEKARGRVKVTEADFRELGGDIELYPGVETWFSRINAFAKEAGVEVEHYVVSAGLKEIILGTPIAGCFKEIYASSFYYSEYGAPVWPCQVVNYTTKTQYLFRISKNCLDLSDEDSVNEYKTDEERRIPFRNFIYVGDSETDIPAMKIVKNGGGTSIGVYNAETANLSRVARLLKQNRIDYLVPALYGEGGRLETLVKDTLRKIAAQEALKRLHITQNDYIDAIFEMDHFLAFLKDALSSSHEAAEPLRRQADQTMAQFRKTMASFVPMAGKEETERILREKAEAIAALFPSQN